MSVDIFVSHAQNGEDVVLRRAFRDLTGPGFYVDIGACHPTEDSVTLHFYEQGWRGINVEPDEVLHAALAEARPRDANICAAIGRTRGRATFQPTGIRGHGTLDPGLARIRAGQAEGAQVPVFTLPDIIDCYGPEDGEVAFLKVDVEGWETEVLASADWDRHRPRVVLVEAVDDTGRPTHEAWEPALLAHRYRFALFDGLNRFYVREEDAALLLPRLAAPANVLDGWRHAREQDAIGRAEALAAKLSAAEARADALGADAEEARSEAFAAVRRREADAEEARREALAAVRQREADAEEARREALAAVRRQEDAVQASVAEARNVLEAELQRAREAEASALRREEAAEARLAELEAATALAPAPAPVAVAAPDRSAEVSNLEVQIANLEAQVAAMRRSTSWRASYPIRLAGKTVYRLAGRNG
ncbi:FkbM family methyltransferase [Belnapia sp. T18]|uniref:FkbM family methyltransferase n=1 Tax=Belnapia arida TaxID=2804533 RepID=A0ABS1U367_9PROT|nr:FkbM family methyltransferase [Belnapia arida]MBL6079101.1 FkbM family methyltransferase [Belnapia arida]